jgi:thioredoxin 1
MKLYEIFFELSDFVTEEDEKTCYNEYTKNKTRSKKGYKIMAAIKVTMENFEEIKASESPVLIDFYAEWCGPCRMVAPIISKIADEHPEYVIGKVNVDEEGELARAFGVMSIPTLVVLKDGKVVNKAIGSKNEAQILNLLKV